MTDTYVVRDPDVAALVSRHDLTLPSLVHTNLEVARCSCRAVSWSTDDACRDCGGTTIQTGTCRTCTSCGTAGGCG